MKRFFEEVDDTLDELSLKYGRVQAYMLAIFLFPIFLYFVYRHSKSK